MMKKNKHQTIECPCYYTIYSGNTNGGSSNK